MYPCFHVDVSMSPFLHVPMSLCLCLHVFMSPYLNVSMSCPPLHISGISQRKTELTENGNFRLFSANGKRKRQTSVCLLQTETENGHLFSRSANDKRKSTVGSETTLSRESRFHISTPPEIEPKDIRQKTVHR
jgi:hypothetical protein